MSAAEPPIPSKPAFLDTMLSEFREVQVHFSPEHRDYKGPCLGETMLFTYGLDLPVPIPDLKMGERGIDATLSFGGVREKTFLPWETIWAITAIEGEDDVGYVWFADMPESKGGRKKSAPAHLPRLPSGKAAPAKKERHLKLVPLEGEQLPLTQPRLTVADLKLWTSARVTQS